MSPRKFNARKKAQLLGASPSQLTGWIYDERGGESYIAFYVGGDTNEPVGIRVSNAEIVIEAGVRKLNTNPRILEEYDRDELPKRETIRGKGREILIPRAVSERVAARRVSAE